MLIPIVLLRGERILFQHKDASRGRQFGDAERVLAISTQESSSLYYQGAAVAVEVRPLRKRVEGKGQRVKKAEGVLEMSERVQR